MEDIFSLHKKEYGVELGGVRSVTRKIKPKGGYTELSEGYILPVSIDQFLIFVTSCEE